MEVQATWIVKVEMKDPQVLQFPATGDPAYTKDDVDLIYRRLRDGLPLDAPRRLAYASVSGGVLTAFFETSTQPSEAECHELFRLTIKALPIFRRPRKFDCVETFAGIQTEIRYLG
jgi:hypothetical protein